MEQLVVVATSLDLRSSLNPLLAAITHHSGPGFRIPLPPASQIPDQRHAALHQRRLRILQALLRYGIEVADEKNIEGGEGE
ncbi:hypothetical protein AB4Y42_32645 [Paraburkholderia sp. EG286B]|uniref:hypothetical protein n=1 Tax=Paraburkholderia sp. EG286B TaxID=3237011 RepID=UPI0034D26B5D